jgi:3-oxoacyl-[acyl-carrier-protein] synthase-3
MAFAKFKTASVRGIVTAIPPVEKCIDDEAELYGGNPRQIAMIKKTIGLDKRRVVEPGSTAADLCEAAARRLYAGGGFSMDNTDAVVFVTQTPDHFQPANAAILHGRLGLPTDCAAFDVNLGCSGYVYGLWLASMMIETECCEDVLLLAGDTMSLCVNPRDRAVAPLFGDAGSATLLSREPDAVHSWYSLKTDGASGDAIKIPAGGFRMPRSEATARESVDKDDNVRSLDDLHMDGAEVFNFSIRVEPEAVRGILEYAGCAIEDVDAFVFHQANRYIIGNIARRLKVPAEKVPVDTVSKYGNQSCASIPATICDALGTRVRAECVRAVLSGFGVGLSWATCLTVLNRLAIAELLEC